MLKSYKNNCDEIKEPEKPVQKRELLGDGYNSALRVMVGMVTTMGFPLVGAVYVGYELYQYSEHKDDIQTDLSEFGIGSLIGELLAESLK